MIGIDSVTGTFIFFACFALVYLACLVILYQTGPKVRKQIKQELPQYAKQVERWLRDPDYYKK